MGEEPNMGCFLCCCRRPEQDHEEEPLIQEARVIAEHRRVVADEPPEPEVYVDDEESMELAIRFTVISELPITNCTHKLIESLSAEKKECMICMNEYEAGEELRFLPCMHIYHRECVDQWLMKALRCPECGARPLEEPTLSSPMPKEV